MKQMLKGELLRKSRELISESNELINQARALETKYNDSQRELQPRIDDLQHQADALVPQFFSRKQKSPEETGIHPKQTGNAQNIQEKYEILNTKANRLRNQLKNIQNEIVNLREKAKELKEKSGAVQKKADESRKTKVGNFEESGIINNEEIEILLDGFPRNIFNEITSLEYDGNAREDVSEWDDGRKAAVKIGRHNDKQGFKDAVTHEIGHIIFSNFLTDGQRGVWKTLHEKDTASGNFVNLNAMSNIEENFTESLAYYKSRFEGTQRHPEERCVFINEILDKL